MVCPRCDLDVKDASEQLEVCEFCRERAKRKLRGPDAPSEQFPAGRRVSS